MYPDQLQIVWASRSSIRLTQHAIQIIIALFLLHQPWTDRVFERVIKSICRMRIGLQCYFETLANSTKWIFEQTSADVGFKTRNPIFEIFFPQLFLSNFLIYFINDLPYRARFKLFQSWKLNFSCLIISSYFGSGFNLEKCILIFIAPRNLDPSY